jgi:predicted methyltransferase
MARIPWPKIAKELMNEYVEGTRCKLCNGEIEQSDNRFKMLANVYKHFKEKHPEKIEEVKQRLAAA